MDLAHSKIDTPGNQNQYDSSHLNGVRSSFNAGMNSELPSLTRSPWRIVAKC